VTTYKIPLHLALLALGSSLALGGIPDTPRDSSEPVLPEPVPKFHALTKAERRARMKNRVRRSRR
jgi:hypothetical protein